MANKHDRYCIEICKAKCCYDFPSKVKCPNLTPSCQCKIYEDRFAEGSKDKEAVAAFLTGEVDDAGLPIIIPFICTKIKVLIANNELPKEIADGCCYVHEELLTKLDSN